MVADRDATEELIVSSSKLYLRNPASLEAADDIITLAYLHEPALLNNLSIRYGKNMIYTYTGSILIAVNPYQTIEGLYSKEMIEAYRGQPLGKLSPHVFAVGEDAFR